MTGGCPRFPSPAAWLSPWLAHQNWRRSLATLGSYVRAQQAWTDNAATGLGL